MSIFNLPFVFSSLARSLCLVALLSAFVYPLRAQLRDSLPPVLLEEIRVTASQTDSSRPITIGNIPKKEITNYLGTKTFPEMMRSVAGVYATSESGSYGDAKINIRGFRQENITVLLNGVPISGLRSGSLFWNNWLGLTDATQSVQVQKGVSASMLVSGSLGGTINMMTKPSEQYAGGAVSTMFTDYGLWKLGVEFSTGLLKRGWAVSFAGSHTQGSGYVDATKVNSWAYFLNVSKLTKGRNSFLFTLLGSPEQHGQRTQKLSEEEVRKYGLKYNKNWGYDEHGVNNLSANTYHKPYLTFNHFYKIPNRLFWANTFYVSVGTGGGKWSESTGKKPGAYLDAQGQIDWEAVVADNKKAPDGRSQNIQSDYLAGHTQVGLKSTIDVFTGTPWKFSAGIHYNYFYSWQNEQITDLLGGTYWYEDYGTNSLAGFAGRDPVKGVGDMIRLDNGNRDHHAALFGQADWKSGRWTAFLGGMWMANVYRRWDKYNYVGDTSSDPVTAWGGSVRGGLQLRAGRQHHVFVNGGVYLRAPYGGAYFSGNTNDVTQNVCNEKNFLAEAGYRLNSSGHQLVINGYYALWKDRSLASNPYKMLDEGQVRYSISGLNAKHMGVELSYDGRFTSWLALSAFVSLGDWRWINDVEATIYDPYTQMAIDTLRVYSKGLFVGDAPQTQCGLVVKLSPVPGLEFKTEYRYNNRMYANFDPAKRTNPNDRSQPFRIPSSQVVDMYAEYTFRVGKLYATAYVNGTNIFDAFYIERGDDGAQHDVDSFRGFWGAGRSVAGGVRVRW